MLEIFKCSECYWVSTVRGTTETLSLTCPVCAASSEYPPVRSSTIKYFLVEAEKEGPKNLRELCRAQSKLIDELTACRKQRRELVNKLSEQKRKTGERDKTIRKLRNEFTIMNRERDLLKALIREAMK